MPYQDFDLYVWREGDQYKAEVRGSPVGASEKVLLHFQFGNEPLENLLLRLENAIYKGRGYRNGPLSSSEDQILRQFGQEVFGAVFRTGGSIAETFSASRKMLDREGGDIVLRLCLHIEPPELAMLPWEYLFDGSARENEEQNYLCLRKRSPLLRFLGARGPGVKPVSGPLRILGMIANPKVDGFAPLDTEAERHRIEQALKDIKKTQVQLEWVRGGSTDDLLDRIDAGPWHVFHFIGHGGVSRSVDPATGVDRSTGYVAMQDGLGGAVKVEASQLGMMLEGAASLRLAVLNCCDGASRGLSSTGATLVSTGVPMVVAMQFPISDGAAAGFAGTFYKSLVSGNPVESALTSARKYVRTKSNLEWGIPVLYTRSGSTVLFDVKAESLADAVPEPVPVARHVLAQQELRRLFA